MRVLHNPVSIFKSIVSFFSPSKPQVPQVDTAAEDARKAQDAKDEAGRKARAAAAKRRGGRSTFLTAPRLGETFKDTPVVKKTLGVS